MGRSTIVRYSFTDKEADDAVDGSEETGVLVKRVILAEQFKSTLRAGVSYGQKFVEIMGRK